VLRKSQNLVQRKERGEGKPTLLKAARADASSESLRVLVYWDSIFAATFISDPFSIRLNPVISYRRETYLRRWTRITPQLGIPKIRYEFFCCKGRKV
jgi:hypothetical protein